jgi:hypothetical protein
MWIDGPDELRLDRQGEYKLCTNTVIEDESKVKIEIQTSPSDKDSIRQDVDKDGNVVFIVRANAQNKLGKLILVAYYDKVECATKAVEIIPLW